MNIWPLKFTRSNKHVKNTRLQYRLTDWLAERYCLGSLYLFLKFNSLCHLGPWFCILWHYTILANLQRDVSLLNISPSLLFILPYMGTLHKMIWLDRPGINQQVKIGHSKTSRESRKAALRISHLLSRCQVVFTKRGTITTTVTTATITTIIIWVFELWHNFSCKILVAQF